MKKTLTIFITALFATALFLSTSFAQEIEKSDSPSSWMITPDVIIKGDELKNFLGGQITEMLLGRLPGIDLTNTADLEVKTIFVVDGIVWPTIDGININNIEEIAYYRGALSSKLGFQNTANGGILFISTKKSGFKQPLSATVNSLLGQNFSGLANEKVKSTLQSYNVILSHGLDKFSWRASAVFNKSSRNLLMDDFSHQYQLNADLRYLPLDWLEIRVNGNYAPMDGDLITQNLGIKDQEFLYKQKNWNGMAIVSIKPLKGLSNEIKYLKNNISEIMATGYTTISMLNSQTYYQLIAQGARIKSDILMNDLNYTFGVNQDKIRFKLGAVYQFNHSKYTQIDERHNGLYDPENTNDHLGTPSGATYTEMWSKTNSHSLISDVAINLYDILTINSGLRLDHINREFWVAPKKSWISPFLSADLNIKNVFFKENNLFSALDLFASYGEYNTAINMLSIESGATNSLIEYSKANGYFSNLDKKTVQGYGLKSSFFDNRFHLAGDWYQNKSTLNASVLLPEMIPSMRLEMAMKDKGWRIWSSAEIFRDTPLKWTMGMNLFRNSNQLGTGDKNSNSIERNQFSEQEKRGYYNRWLNPSDGNSVKIDPTTGREVDNKSPSSLEDIIYNGNSSSSKLPLQAGMQHQFAFGPLSLSVNLYGYFNQWAYSSSLIESPNGPVRYLRQTSYINLQETYIGYTFDKKVLRNTFREVTIGLVSRNSGHYQKNISDNLPTKSLGIALNATW